MMLRRNDRNLENIPVGALGLIADSPVRQVLIFSLQLPYSFPHLFLHFVLIIYTFQSIAYIF